MLKNQAFFPAKRGGLYKKQARLDAFSSETLTLLTRHFTQASSERRVVKQSKGILCVKVVSPCVAKLLSSGRRASQVFYGFPYLADGASVAV